LNPDHSALLLLAAFLHKEVTILPSRDKIYSGTVAKCWVFNTEIGAKAFIQGCPFNPWVGCLRPGSNFRNN